MIVDTCMRKNDRLQHIFNSKRKHCNRQLWKKIGAIGFTTCNIYIYILAVVLNALKNKKNPIKDLSNNENTFS